MPKASSKKPPRPAGKRSTVLAIKGSPAYQAWLAEVSGKSLIPVTAIARDAIARWAKDRGYAPPPAI